jgi:hypothetical protein
MDLLSLPLKVGQAAKLTQNAGTSPSEQNIPSTIEQTERLFTARTRGINYQTGGGDRGQHTFVQLLTQKKSNLISSHVSESGAKSSSLGSDTKGALADAAAGKYGEFLLTDIRVSLDEKLQISETMGDAEIVYYFGRQPINVQFQGILIDSPDNNWFIQFVEMYAHVMRGSELARNYELLKIITPNMTFIGTINHLDWSQNSQRETDIPFGFTMLVKQIIPNAVMVPGKPTSVGVTINSGKGAAFRTQSEIMSMKQKASGIMNAVTNPMSTLKDLAGAMNAKTIMDGGGSWGGSALSNIGGSPAGSGFGVSGSTIGLSGGSGSTASGGLFSNVTSTLAGVRASLFSPVYGVLSSLTKLIKNVTGTINGVISAFTNPVRDILRDIRNISNQAIGVVNMINHSIDGFTSQIRNMDNDLRSTLATLKMTAGVISTAPQTITSHLRSLVNAGKLPATVGFLQNPKTFKLSSGTKHTTKIFLLNSGPKHTPERGARL